MTQNWGSALAEVIVPPPAPILLGKTMTIIRQSSTDKTQTNHNSLTSSRSFSRRSLHGQVAHDIGRRILGGLVKPGELLPSETELSQRLGVSRTALREAIKVLAGKGLIESRPKTGTRVRPRESWNFLDPDVLTWAFDGAAAEQYVDELYELRRVIEPAAAAFAADRANPADIARMEAAFEGMTAAGDNGEAYFVPDMTFHLSILRATGNELLRSLGSVVEVALAISIRLSIASASPKGHKHSLPLHGAVLKAIRRHDAAGAREAMMLLIDISKRDLAAGLAAQAGSAEPAEPAVVLQGAAAT
jgi:DNA-binding FadR family transcriptional regulator